MVTLQKALWGITLVVLVTCPYHTQARIGTFWHVTDFHYDVNYTTTGDSQNMCWDHSVAMNQRVNEQGSTSPGKFGDYDCDAPLELVTAAIQAMVKIQPKPDFILWTGDDTAHVADKYFTTTKVVNIIHELTDKLNRSFPNTTFFPVLGNHDYYPKNQVPVGESDLQGEVAKLWKKWLNDEAHESFQKDGRYWADVPGTNVTIIGLNTLTWYKSNINTAKLPDTDPNGQDPGQQFAWANNILTTLAKRRRRVYLMGHIPPGTFERYQQKKEGFHWYQTRYNDQFIKMVQNHAEVIEAQFFAHHHTDSFRLFFKNQQDHDPGIPVSYQLIAPGVTPWRSTLSKETGANNPGIRLISYDTVTGKVKEVSTYYLDLAQANKDGKADFKFEYNFTSEYNLTSINPESLYNLAKNMKKNSTLFNKYYKANTVSLESPSVCTTNCHLLHWCSITEVNYNRFNTCNAASTTSLHWAAGSLLAVGLLLVNR